MSKTFCDVSVMRTTTNQREADYITLEIDDKQSERWRVELSLEDWAYVSTGRLSAGLLKKKRTTTPPLNKPEERE